MTSSATTVEEYLAGLPEDRREWIGKIRDTILANLQPGFEEGMQYGHIGYFVPHSIHPGGYHCDPKQPLPFCGLGSQKQHFAWYAFCLYTDQKHLDWFVKEYEKTGKRMDMGKGCVRFKKWDDVPLELIGEAIKRISVDDFLGNYLLSVPASKRKK